MRQPVTKFPLSLVSSFKVGRKTEQTSPALQAFLVLARRLNLDCCVPLLCLGHRRDTRAELFCFLAADAGSFEFLEIEQSQDSCGRTQLLRELLA